MSSRLRAVVFDLDGLMLNTEELYQHCGTVVLQRRGKEFTDELLDQIMGRQPEIALQMMVDYHDLDVTAADLGRESQEVFREILDDRLRPMPGLLDLLEQLESQQIPKAVATSSGREFTTHVLGRFDLEPRFAFVLTSDDVRHGKPEPDIYHKAAELHGVSTAEMLVLEDSHNGCRAAVAAGAFAVAVPGGRSRHHDFEGAALIADSLADPRISEVLGLSRAE